MFASKVFSSEVGGFGDLYLEDLERGDRRSEVGGRTRERDGGLQPPIERLVYIYIYPDNVGPRVLSVFWCFLVRPGLLARRSDIIDICRQFNRTP